MKITKGIKPKPRNILLYGEHGTGKTTLASTFPSPLIIDVEGGSDDIDVARTDRITSYGLFQEAVNILLTTDHEFRTVVIDSVDWLEKLVQSHVAQVRGKSSIGDIDYGKGYTFSADEFNRIVASIKSLNSRGFACILICHAKATKFSPPGANSYQRWEPDLHDGVQSTLLEFCDEVLFIRKTVLTEKEDLGFNRTHMIQKAVEQRELVTADTGAVVAKNRIPGMPSVIPATFDAYKQYLAASRARSATTIQPQPEPQKTETETEGNIDGIVTNGHSKPERNSEAKQETETTFNELETFINQNA